MSRGAHYSRPGLCLSDRFRVAIALRSPRLHLGLVVSDGLGRRICLRLQRDLEELDVLGLSRVHAWGRGSYRFQSFRPQRFQGFRLKGFSRLKDVGTSSTDAGVY